MNEKEKLSFADPTENRLQLRGQLREIGYTLGEVKDRAVLGCGGILIGGCLSGLGGYVIYRAFEHQSLLMKGAIIAVGAVPVVIGLATILLSLDNEQSSY